MIALHTDIVNALTEHVPFLGYSKKLLSFSLSG